MLNLLFLKLSALLFRSHPILQKTIESLFGERSELLHPGACKWIRPSPRQNKMCRRDPALAEILATARIQAVRACEEAFKYDRWNCSLVFNRNDKKGVFKKIYRETALAFALTAASLSHAVAKGCASGDLVKCPCAEDRPLYQWKMNGCGDDYKYGKRITRNFLDLKHAGADHIAEALKQDVLVGVEAIGEQLREVCKCHGFSGSCTTKTCWKRLSPFNSAMGLLKKQYHHAVRKKLVNYTTKRAITPRLRKKIKVDRKSLVYLQKTPNLCASTQGRECKDKQNCATLCCGRGYFKFQRPVESRCRCKMVNCCYVKCDTCVQNVDYFSCK